MAAEALGRAARGALAVATATAAASAADDGVLYWKCRRAALDAAAAHGELAATLGTPLRAGPWYDTSVRTRGGGGLVTCQLTVDGAAASSDVVVRLARADRGSSGLAGWDGWLPVTLAYNVVGRGEWVVLTCVAMLPTVKDGGVPRAFDLIPAPAAEAHTAAGARAAPAQSPAHGQ